MPVHDAGARHEHGVRTADDDRIEDAEHDIALQDAVAAREEAHGDLVALLGKQGLQESLSAALEGLLRCEQVHRKHEREPPHHKALARGHGNVEDVLHVVPGDFQQVAHEVARRSHELIEVDVFRDAPCVGKLHEGGDVSVHIGCEHRDAFDKLRNQGAQDEGEEQDECEHCEDDRCEPAEVGLPHVLEHRAVEEHGERVQEIGDHAAQKRGAEEAEERGRNIENGVEVRQSHIHNDRDACCDGIRIPFLFVKLLPHGASSNLFISIVCHQEGARMRTAWPSLQTAPCSSAWQSITTAISNAYQFNKHMF